MPTPLFDQKSYDAWMLLSEEIKQKTLEKAFGILWAVGRQQLGYIEDWKRRSDDDKELGHIYVFNTIEIFWENIGLLLFLGEGKYANFGSYPARTCTEIFLQFNSFCQKNQTLRDEIAVKELLRNCVRYYLREKFGQGETKFYSDFYGSHAAELSLPPIESLNDENLEDFERNHLKTFPSIRRLSNDYSKEGGRLIYFFYQWLCEDVHGKILANVMRKQAVQQEQYRRALMTIFSFCKDMLVLSDRNFLRSSFKKEVLEAIGAVDTMLLGLVS